MEKDLIVNVFGYPRIILEGNDILFQRRKVLALFIYLLCHDKHISRDILVDLFYPEYDRTRARANFRQSLSILKSLIGESFLRTSRTSVGLDRRDRIHLDLNLFTELLQSDPVIAEKKYGGEFLAGFYLDDSPRFEEWQYHMRNDLAGSYISLLEKLIAGARRRGDYKGAIAYALKLINQEKFNDDFHKLLLELYYKTGQLDRAMHHYDRYCRILKDEFSLTPDDEIANIHKKLKLRITGNQKSLKLCLVGRVVEYEAIMSYLDRRKRHPLIITGCAGVGKSRLIMAVAEELSQKGTEPLIYIDLSEIEGMNGFLPFLAERLNVKEYHFSRDSLMERVQSAMKNGFGILILDNYDVLPHEGKKMIRTLSLWKTGYRIIITSREALFPETDEALSLKPFEAPLVNCDDIDEIRRNSAVRIFLNTAEEVCPGFEPSRKELQEISRLCRSLGGLPLTLKLAAGRLKSLHPGYGAADAADKETGFSDLFPEQLFGDGSLRPFFYWSLAMLDRQEKNVLHYLAVFSGGAPYQALEEMRSALSDNPLDISDILHSLRERSWITRDDSSGETRFAVVNTLREYLLSLSECGDGDQFSKYKMIHSRYYFGFIRSQAPGLYGPDQMEILDNILGEKSNLERALNWFFETEDIPSLSKMLIRLYWFWFRCGFFSEGFAFLERGWALFSSGDRSREKAEVGQALSWFAFLKGQWEKAGALQSLCLGIFRENGDKGGESRTLSYLGVSLHMLGRTVEGSIIEEKAVSLARKSGDRHRILYSLVWAYATKGGVLDSPTHSRFLEEALDLARGQCDYWAIYVCLSGLGDYFRQRADLDKALGYYKEALSGFERLGDKWLYAWNLEGLGRTLFSLEKFIKAEKVFSRAFRYFDSLGDRSDALHIASWLGMCAYKKGDMGRASVLLAAFPGLYKEYSGKASIEDLYIYQMLNEASWNCRRELLSKWIEGLSLPYRDLREKIVSSSKKHLWNDGGTVDSYN